MALQLLAVAFCLLASTIYAECVSKPCNSDYHITSWNPVREGSQTVYYYEVKTDGCVGVVFTDVLLQTSLSCQNCSQIYCYDSNWNVVRCNYPPSWVLSDSFLRSKLVSDTFGLKFTLPQSTVLRFSLNVNPGTTRSAQGKMYIKGNSWTNCPVITPVCNCACSPCMNGTYQITPCNATSNTVCANCTQCVANMTYESLPCTATQNRQCINCTRCTAGQFETVACAGNRNRICTNCSQCTPNMTFEVAPCTNLTNRVCDPCTQCVQGRFQTVACAGNTNRVCTNCSQCVPNMTFEVAPCTNLTNRVCDPCTQCVQGRFQTVACAGKTNRVCTNCTQCVTAMTYEVAPCTNLTNRQCANCTICANGFFEVAPCNATSDRVCQRCSDCAPGEEVRSPCNATHDVVCGNCSTCANCSAIPNSHLTNNGRACACNEGYTEIASDNGPTCVATPCCADCQSCGFNRSAPCYAHDPNLCNYECNYHSTCTLGTTPQDTGYTVVYNGMTVDAACCGATGGQCSCFSYQLSASSFPLNDFVLGLNCPDLQLCAPPSPPPTCLQTILRDGVDGQVTFGIPGQPDPFTNVTGIDITGLNLNLDTTTLTFVFQGYYNESSIPITFSAGAQSTTSEDRTCLVSSINGPACVDCSTNPTAVFAVKTLQMWKAKPNTYGSRFNGRKIRV